MKPYVFTKNAFPSSSPIPGGEDEEWAENGGDKNEKEDKSGQSEDESKLSPPPPPSKTDDQDQIEVKDEEDKESEKPPPLTESKVRVVASLATDPARMSAEGVRLAVTPEIRPMATSPYKEPKQIDVKPVIDSKDALDYVASLPPAIQSAIAAGRFLCLPPGGDVNRSKPPDPPDARPGLGYLCQPCGIRFSSASTLEAHQTYYCSHRAQRPEPARNSGDSEGEEVRSVSGDSKSEELPAKIDLSESAPKAIRTGKQYKCPHCSYSADKKVSLNRHMRMHSASPIDDGPAQAPSAATPLVDRYCQDCDIRFSSLKTFRAHKTHYCGTRHAIGGKPKSPPLADSASPPPVPQPKPFLVLPTNPVLIVPYSLVQGASLISGPAAAGITAVDTASVLLPDGTLQPLPLALGHSQVANPPAKVVYPPHSENKVSKTVVENLRKIEGGREVTSPLDLSYRRSSEREVVAMDSEDKENRRILHNRNTPSESPEHEDIICAPSIPLILSTSSTCSSPSPSPLSPALSSHSASSKKQERKESVSLSPKASVSPKSPRTTPNGFKRDEKKKGDSPMKTEANINLQNLLLAAVAQNQEFPRVPIPPELMPHLSAMCARIPDGKPPIGLGVPRPGDPLIPFLPPDLALRMADLPPPPPPPVLVKQGESKCNECNIVFYRIENFVAHKMYYCGANLAKSDDKSPSSPPHSSSPKDLPPKSPPPAPSTSKLPMYQFICAACGIKFTSYDNLTAHQTYYCPKRSMIEPEKLRRCSKCKVVAGSDHQCGGAPIQASGWKCPCCPVTSATATQAQKHMESHSGVKAFLCTICRYKGNTLRGMRTHIRMHFDKKPTEINEENFITCIIDEPNVIKAEQSPTEEKKDDQPIAPPPPLPSSESCNGGESVKVKQEEPDRADDELIDVDSVTVVKSEPRSVTNSDDSPPDDLSSNNNKKISPRYCKSCDISFNYLSTFIAHKRFYCPSHVYDNSSPPAPTQPADNNNSNTSRQTGTPVS